jgi:hypothetical protein
VPFGVFFQDFDGQNTLVSTRDTTAGMSVTTATAISATAMDRPGPRLVNAPNTASSNAMNAMMIAAAAEAMTSPTLATAATSAVFGSSPARSRSR